MGWGGLGVGGWEGGWRLNGRGFCDRDADVWACFRAMCGLSHGRGARDLKGAPPLYDVTP